MTLRQLASILILLVIGTNLFSQSVLKTYKEPVWNCSCLPSMPQSSVMEYTYPVINTGNTKIMFDQNNLTTFDHHIRILNHDIPSEVSYSLTNQQAVDLAISLKNFNTLEPIDSLNPGDTMLVTAHDYTNPFYYKVGNNTLVIWPENLDGATVTDSFKVALEIVENNFANSTGKQEIKVFPNPSNGQFTVTLNGIKNTPFQISDVQGRTVVNGTFWSDSMVQNLSKGTYFLKTTLNHRVYQTKIVVK